jgi:hypothetical protein
MSKYVLIYSTKTDGYEYNMNNSTFDVKEKDHKIKSLFNKK